MSALGEEGASETSVRHFSCFRCGSPLASVVSQRSLASIHPAIREARWDDRVFLQARHDVLALLVAFIDIIVELDALDA